MPLPLALPLIKSCSCLSQSYWSRFSSVRSPWSSCRRRSATLRAAALSGESIHALRMVTTSWMSWSSFAIANSWCLSGSRCQTSCASQELACARVLAQATSRGSRMCSAAFTRVTRGLERGALLREKVFKVQNDRVLKAAAGVQNDRVLKRRGEDGQTVSKSNYLEKPPTPWHDPKWLRTMMV